jgi:hypothetical protein
VHHLKKRAMDWNGCKASIFAVRPQHAGMPTAIRQRSRRAVKKPRSMVYQNLNFADYTKSWNLPEKF